MLALAIAVLSLGFLYFAVRALRIARRTRAELAARDQAAWAFAEQVRWEHYELERSLE